MILVKSAGCGLMTKPAARQRVPVYVWMFLRRPAQYQISSASDADAGDTMAIMAYRIFPSVECSSIQQRVSFARGGITLGKSTETSQGIHGNMKLILFGRLTTSITTSANTTRKMKCKKAYISCRERWNVQICHHNTKRNHRLLFR